jgi:hypothetical protein
MSHAINMAFHLVDATKMVGLRSTRLRPTHAAAIAAAANKNFHYIASVDEMKGFLTDQFGDGHASAVEVIHSGPAWDPGLHGHFTLGSSHGNLDGQ